MNKAILADLSWDELEDYTMKCLEQIRQMRMAFMDAVLSFNRWANCDIATLHVTEGYAVPADPFATFVPVLGDFFSIDSDDEAQAKAAQDALDAKEEEWAKRQARVIKQFVKAQESNEAQEA